MDINIIRMIGKVARALGMLHLSATCTRIAWRMTGSDVAMGGFTPAPWSAYYYLGRVTR